MNPSMNWLLEPAGRRSSVFALCQFAENSTLRPVSQPGHDIIRGVTSKSNGHMAIMPSFLSEDLARIFFGVLVSNRTDLQRIGCVLRVTDSGIVCEFTPPPNTPLSGKRYALLASAQREQEGLWTLRQLTVPFITDSKASFSEGLVIKYQQFSIERWWFDHEG